MLVRAPISRKLRLFLSALFLSLLSFTAVSSNDKDSDFSEAELHQILAPVALYPDSLLTHILIASTYPLEIIQASRWARKHSELETSEALERVENKDWDPSVKALVPFPRVLKRLSNDLSWTQNMGDAFLQNEEGVLDTIQSLRRSADREGNLKKMKHVNVTREKKIIIIEPAVREVVYVPYYDTRVIYGRWHWSSYPPVYWTHHHYHHNHGPFYWNPGIHFSFSLFPGAFHWHNRHLVVINHRHHRARHNYHRKPWHRSHIIRHQNARRWTHNPSHRRGLAYRSERTRQRYHSNRPSRIQSRATRVSETHRVSNRHRVNNSVSSSRSSSRRMPESKVSNRATRNNNRKYQQSSIARQKHKASTRQEKFKRKLTNRKTSNRSNIQPRNKTQRKNYNVKSGKNNNNAQQRHNTRLKNRIDSRVRKNANTQRNNFQKRNAQNRNAQQRNIQKSNVQKRSSQQRNVQQRNAQKRNVQKRNAQQRNVQKRNAQQRNVQKRNVQRRPSQKQESQRPARQKQQARNHRAVRKNVTSGRRTGEQKRRNN